MQIRRSQIGAYPPLTIDYKRSLRESVHIHFSV
jgi:hypothetical protein